MAPQITKEAKTNSGMFGMGIFTGGGGGGPKKNLSERLADSYSFGNMMWETTCTFTCQRELRVRHAGLALTHRILQLCIFLYVVLTMSLSYTYLSFEVPTGTANAWWSTGTFWTGEGQTFQDNAGNTQNYVASEPHYCESPYTNDYHYSSQFTYGNISCVVLPPAELVIKNTPTFMFYTTFVQDTTTEAQRCSDNMPSCNSNTPGVSVHGDSCVCSTSFNYYTANPEGLRLALENDFFEAETGLHGGSHGTNSFLDGKKNNLKTKVVVRKDRWDHENLKEFEWGADISFSMAEILQFAGVNLDDRAPIGTTPGSTNTADQPFNRLSGVELLFDMEFVNAQDANPGLKKDSNRIHDMICVITIERVGRWSTLGTNIVDYLNPVSYLASAASGVTARTPKVYTGKYTDRYRHGIKVIMKAHGKIGHFDVTYFIGALTQGLVLLGLATTITQSLFLYVLPLFGEHDDCAFKAAVFTNYQSTFIDPKKVAAKAAMTAAINSAQFVRTFDPTNRMKLSKKTLYQQLRLCLGGSLKNEEIATLTKQILQFVKIGGTEIDDFDELNIDVDEFCNFMCPDECDLLNLVLKYHPQNDEIGKKLDDPDNVSRANRLDTPAEGDDEWVQGLMQRIKKKEAEGGTHSLEELHRAESNMTSIQMQA